MAKNVGEIIRHLTEPQEDVAGLSLGQIAMLAELAREKARAYDRVANRSKYETTKQQHQRMAGEYRDAARKLEDVYNERRIKE